MLSEPWPLACKRAGAPEVAVDAELEQTPTECAMCGKTMTEPWTGESVKLPLFCSQDCWRAWFERYADFATHQAEAEPEPGV